MADTVSIVYDATGPSRHSVIFAKHGTGQAYMQGVGNTLYMGDGTFPQQWLQPPDWQALEQVTLGQTVIDSNGNIEYLQAIQVGTINNVQVTSNVAQITFDASAFGVNQGMTFTPTGLGAAAFLNNQLLVAITVIVSGSNYIVTAVFPHTNYASTPDSGIATTTDVGTPGVTGGTTPSWSLGVHNPTTDALLTWENFGNPVYPIGIKAPTIAPTIGAIPGGNTTIWQATTQMPTHAFILDSAGNIQQVITAGGYTGVRLPSFNAPNALPNFSNGIVADGSVNWGVVGSFTNTWPGPSTLIDSQIGSFLGGYVIVDPNGNLQQANPTVVGATTGVTEPTWNQTVGGTTTDHTITWLNQGPVFGLAFTGWQYGYAYHAIDGSLSTLSPLSPLTNGVLTGVYIQGPVPDVGQAPVDSIWLFRTTDGGAAPLFLASIRNFGAGWNYIDENPDSALILEIPAQQADSNDPPPSGLINLTYYLQRMWGSVKNVVYFSAGPDTISGNGLTAFPPANSFVFPSTVTRLKPTNQGMIVFTKSVCGTISGNGTANSPFFAPPFLSKIGLASYNAFDENGSVQYLLTADGHVVELDPNSGISELGFPIGDLFDNNFDPATAYVAWHIEGSEDKALYVADGSTGWFRMNPTPAPETGTTWSPFATIVGGVKAVQSIEVTPGVRKLLLGPVTTGPILMRDLNTFSDNGQTYPWFATVGSIILAQPGELAEISFFMTECSAVGTRPTISVLLDEISGPFEKLPTSVNATVLPTSTSLYNDWFYLTQGVDPALCRHLQLKFSFPPEAAKNELLTYTIFGRHLSERG